MIKAILKKILPVALRKQLFLMYNKTRIATIDKLLFPEFHIPESSFILYKKVCPLKDFGIRLDDGNDPVINHYLSFWNDWTEEEYIYVHKDGGLIEPSGWHITKEGKLNYYSLGLSRAPHNIKPSYLKLKGKKSIIKAEKIISLRDTGDENYFHFYNDVLAKLFLLKKHGFAIEEYQILVSGVQVRKPFFGYYKEHHPELKKLRWLVQEDTEYVEANEIVFSKPETHRMDLLQQIVAPFKMQPAASSAYEEKIFLSRNPKRLRFIENMDELQPVLQEYGYRVFDADNLNLNEQIELFAGMDYLIGIHGAGFTNLLYTHHLKVLVEIFPPTSEPWLPFHYGLMAKQLGVKYIPLIGEPPQKSYSGGFRLNAQTLKKAIESIGN